MNVLILTCSSVNNDFYYMYMHGIKRVANHLVSHVGSSVAQSVQSRITINQQIKNKLVSNVLSTQMSYFHDTIIENTN